MEIKKILASIASLAVLAGCAQKATAPQTYYGEDALPEGFTVTAHSGAYDTPDNSVEYIQAALDHNAQILEFDVRQRPNGVLAMKHDDLIDDQDGVEIDSILKMINPSSTRVNLDIKDIRTIPELRRLILENEMLDQVFLTGIERAESKIVKAQFPEITYFLNCSPEIGRIDDPAYQKEIISLLEETGAMGINCNFKYANKVLADLLHANGYKLSLWTVSKEEDMKLVLPYHPDNITSRQPLMLEALLTRK